MGILDESIYVSLATAFSRVLLLLLRLKVARSATLRKSSQQSAVRYCCQILRVDRFGPCLLLQVLNVVCCWGHNMRARLGNERK